MIQGLGIDIVELARIARAMQNPRFVLRILTSKERERELTPQYVAGRWAAKEAIAKAVPLKLRWHDVEVLGTENGPLATVRGLPGQVLISITHERGMAASVAVYVAAG